MTETNFKHTDLGLIPHDWEVKTIEDIARIVGGGTPSTAVSTYWNGGIQWFTPAEITKAPKYVSTSERNISLLGLNNSSAKMLPKGTVLLTTRATIGAAAILLCEACTNQGFQSLIAKDENSNEFLYYLIPLIKGEMFNQASGSTFPEISPKKLAKIHVALPPKLEEQERIAGALSSIDTLIGALTEQIEKKRHIKQGAMQQLLTGKKRLVGFTGEWKSVKLSEICDFAKGKGLKKEYLTDSGQYRCILYGEIFTKYDGIIKSVVSRTDVYEGTLSKKCDVLMPGSTTTIGIDLVKAVALNEDNILLGGDVIILRPKEKQACADFLAYLISNVDRNKVADVTQGITIIHLHAKNMVDIMYTIPPTIAEQSAIAAVLYRMDTEIAALEQKRDKYIAIKSGMMQNLLTGKIRLV